MQIIFEPLPNQWVVNGKQSLLLDPINSDVHSHTQEITSTMKDRLPHKCHSKSKIKGGTRRSGRATA